MEDCSFACEGLVDERQLTELLAVFGRSPRPRRRSAAKRHQAEAMRERSHLVTEIAEVLGFSRATVYCHLEAPAVTP